MLQFLSYVFFLVFFQPQSATNQNGSTASTSEPTSGSGSLGSGPVSGSTMPHGGGGMPGKPRFIAVTSLEDIQVCGIKLFYSSNKDHTEFIFTIFLFLFFLLLCRQ